MNTFNRIVAIVLWLLLLTSLALVAVAPLQTVAYAQTLLGRAMETLTSRATENPANFLIGQAAVGVASVLLFGLLIGLEIWSGRRRGVRIRTTQGGSAELDTSSIGRRLSWHLDQLAEVISVVPSVRSKGGSVDIKLEIETAPDVDVPTKTDEVVAVTRELVEQEMGLKLGKLDVHMRYAPIEPEWAR